MSEKTVTQLPADTVKLITSTQVITSVSTAVKELVENSIDAGAKFIQIRLENYGLDVIEVKDDGSGVSYDNVQRMFLPGNTSKIRQFEDLDKLHTYGFRGEALAALCKMAKILITTKTNLDTVAMTYNIDATGLPLSSKPSHLNKGTLIVISDLFYNVPVRRLHLSSNKKKSEDLKKAEQVVQSLSLIHPELSVSMIHNKCPIWKKNSVKGIKQSFMQIVGLKIVSKMDHLNKVLDQINVDLIIPKKNLENSENIFTNSPHSIYLYVNKRPVTSKNLSQPVQEHIFHHYTGLNITFKYAVCLISIEVSPQQLDVNLEPNKTKILLKNQLEILKIIDKTLSDYYGHSNFNCTAVREAVVEEVPVEEEAEQQPDNKRPRLEVESVGERRNKEFIEKNKGWHLEIINEDCTVSTKMNSQDLFESENLNCMNMASGPQSLCSQINKNNCVLTTELEVSALNAVLNDTNFKLVTSTNISNKNSESSPVDINDIQSRSRETPILPEWPCRPKITVEPQQSTSDANTQELDEVIPSVVNSKTVEELAAEIESDAEKWSSAMMQAMQNEKNVKQEDVKSLNVMEDDLEKFNMSIQSVSSQMKKKEMKAFTKFARIMRPKIAEEFPNLIFTQVASILVERWKSLTADEVKYYEKMAEVVDMNKKIYLEEKQKENPKIPEKPSKPTCNKNKNLKSLFEQMKKTNKLSRPPRKEVSLHASLNDIKELRTSKSSDDIKDDLIQIIGQLQPSGNWLYKKGKEIGHVRHHGLQELIISQKMLSSHTVPRKVLEKPIFINEELIGTVLWNILISLETTFDVNSSKYVIISEVITKNGFLIEIEKNDDLISSANIIEVALHIPHYGIPELKDALNMYQSNGEFGGLANWRSTAVYNYITNEAIRLAHQTTTPPDREEIEGMMTTYHLCLRHLPPICLHSKEIFVPFYSLEDELTSCQLQNQ